MNGRGVTMSKSYKEKHNKPNEENDNVNSGLSKKEIYDLKQKEKKEAKEKEKAKTKAKKKKKISNKTYRTNKLGRIFAIIMLILMLGSIIGTFAYYFSGTK